MKRDVHSQECCLPLTMPLSQRIVPGGSIYYTPIQFAYVGIKGRGV